MHGKRQNVNESFKKVIWTQVPKTIFVGEKTLELGVYDAVLGFNEGNIGRISVLKSRSQNTTTILKQLDDFELQEIIKHTNQIVAKQLNHQTQT